MRAVVPQKGIKVELTDPRLFAKKAAVTVDEGTKRRAAAIGDFSLSHAPEVLENLLNLMMASD